MPEPAHVKRLDRALEALRALPDPMTRLNATRLAREALDRLETETAKDARVAGATWAEIGELYGLTKQGAQQRFRPKRSMDGSDL